MMRDKAMGIFTAFCVTVIVAAEFSVVLFGADWALISLFHLPASVGWGVYAVSAMAAVAFAAWFGLTAWKAERRIIDLTTGQGTGAVPAVDFRNDGDRS